MAIINKTGIGNGNTIQAEHVTRIIDALSGQSTDTVAATGSFQGTFDGTSAILTSATINGTLENGTNVIASGLNSHAEGSNTLATYLASHAEGYNTTASAVYSHTEGGNTTTTGNYSHAEGEYGVASGRGAHAEGYNTVASNDYSNAKGYKTLASGRYSLSIGQQTTASADQSFASGYGTIASANGAHSAGLWTTASGQYSQAAGESTDAEAKGSHAEGLNTVTQGNYSHAEGRGTYTYGTSSHAEGRNTSASGDYSHAEGRETVSIGDYSHAEGYQTTASGDYSHAEGIGTVASGSGQLVSGKYNTHGDSTSLFIIGDGTSNGARSDVFKAKTNEIEITGSLSILKAGATLKLVGTDHTYVALYPDGVAAGRKGWIGYGSSADDNLTIYNETGSGGLVFKTDSGTNIYVSASGNVGIGTITPESKLHVVGSVKLVGAGATSATTAFNIQNSSNISMLNVTDAGATIMKYSALGAGAYPQSTGTRLVTDTKAIITNNVAGTVYFSGSNLWIARSSSVSGDDIDIVNNIETIHSNLVLLGGWTSSAIYINPGGA